MQCIPKGKAKYEIHTLNVKLVELTLLMTKFPGLNNAHNASIFLAMVVLSVAKILPKFPTHWEASVFKLYVTSNFTL